MKEEMSEMWHALFRPLIMQTFVCPFLGHFVKFSSAPLCMRCYRDAGR